MRAFRWQSLAAAARRRQRVGGARHLATALRRAAATAALAERLEAAGTKCSSLSANSSAQAPCSRPQLVRPSTMVCRCSVFVFRRCSVQATLPNANRCLPAHFGGGGGSIRPAILGLQTTPGFSPGLPRPRRAGEGPRRPPPRRADLRLAKYVRLPTSRRRSEAETSPARRGRGPGFTPPTRR